MSKLTNNQKHLLRLCKQGQKQDGWANVSSMVWPLLKDVPTELIDLLSTDTSQGGKAKLTQAGETVVEWI